MGQSINLNYRNEGTYTWDYKLTLTSGQIRYSHSKLLVGNQIAPIGSAQATTAPWSSQKQKN
jgi:hypothetical protein